MNLVLYGPPGSGKTSVGQVLAERLGREFVDADTLIESRLGVTIERFFSEQGEAEFRRLEAQACAELAARTELVIAPGGGALLDPANRAALGRTGLIVCLRAPAEELLARLRNSPTPRPLLAGDAAAKLNALLAARRPLYDSFPVQLETSGKAVAQVAAEIAALLTPRAIPVNAPGLRHDILLGYDLLRQLPELLAARGFTGPAVMVTDENISGAFPSVVQSPSSIVIPAGEQHKTLDTIGALYDGFLAHGLDRTGVVVAMGGGVIGDTAGFAAATFMRGVPWVNVPTTLLAMVDASLGGKTGVDLPQGKNLVGAFHPPTLVVSDPLALNSLPEAERISGMAEVIKHGLIGDEVLFEGLEALPVFGGLDQLERAIRVKIRVVEADPFEKGQRAILNIGHTIGHGVEAASGYRWRHGECVAIGLCGEALVAERLGLAERGLTGRVESVLRRVGLPTRCPGLDATAIRTAMSSDKKKAGGKLKFALPKRVGEAGWGIGVEEMLVREVLNGLCAAGLE